MAETRRRTSVAILVSTQLATFRTAKNVRRWGAIFFQCRKKLIPLRPIGEPSGILNCGYRLRSEGVQFVPTRASDELGGIAAVRPPPFLLPTSKAWCTMGYFFYYFTGDLIPRAIATNPMFIGETRFKFLVSRAVGDAPRADTLVVFFDGIDRAGVDESTRFAAAFTFRAGDDDVSSRDGVGVVFEGWQHHVRHPITFPAQNPDTG